MAKPVTNLRLFAAIYPPVSLVEQWRSALAKLDLPQHRAVPLEQVHLTLQFIGDTPAKALDDVIESVERAAAGLRGFELTTEQLIRLPERGPARLIAMEINAQPTLLELQRRLAVRLARNVREQPGRGFRPHLTLCRFRSPARLSEMRSDVATASFSATSIQLMRSTLKPEGAEHVEVMSVSLL